MKAVFFAFLVFALIWVIGQFAIATGSTGVDVQGVGSLTSAIANFFHILGL